MNARFFDEESNTYIDWKSAVAEIKEKLLNKLVLDLYKENQQFLPSYPWIFVRVMNRTQKVGSVWTPDSAQNKTTHEGIVLSTWKPFTKVIGHEAKNGRRIEKTIMKQSDLTPGDHVLFAHWAGLPVVGYSEERYRIVKEEGWTKDSDGGIFATVQYDEGHTRPNEVLREMLQELAGTESPVDELSGAQVSLIAANIEDRFLLVDREANSLTLSGK